MKTSERTFSPVGGSAVLLCSCTRSWTLLGRGVGLPVPLLGPSQVRHGWVRWTSTEQGFTALAQSILSLNLPIHKISGSTVPCVNEPMRGCAENADPWAPLLAMSS